MATNPFNSISYIYDYYYDDGRCYSGQMLNDDKCKGIPHGQGLMLWPDGTRYKGEWRNGREHGRGRKVTRFGNSCYQYEGQWRKGLEHGQGVEVWDGGCYEGQFQHGQRHGQGVMHWEAGLMGLSLVYSGQWRDGKRFGQGEQSWSDGSHYVGGWGGDRWRHECLTGLGVYFHPDGRRSEGQWRESVLLTGLGRALFISVDWCERYEGGWNAERRRQGYGVQTWSDGARYEGEYDEDEEHGWGVFIHPNGRRSEGRWESGFLDIGSDRALIIYPDMCRYEGGFKNGQLAGKGIFTACDGRSKKWENAVEAETAAG